MGGRFWCGFGETRVKKVRVTLCTFEIDTSSPGRVPKSLESGGIRNWRKQESPWKKGQIGRERPHFFGFQPPKKFLGSLPPSQALRVDELRGDCAGTRPCQTRCLTF